MKRTIFFAILFALAPALASTQGAPRFDIRGTQFGDTIEHRELCQPGSVTGEHRCRYEGVQIGDEVVTITYEYLDEHLYGVELSFEPSAFYQLSSAFRAKYGTPASERSEGFRTVGGARATNTILTWRFREGVFRLQKYGASLTDGYGGISTAVGRREFAKREAAKIKADARRDLGPPVTP